MRPLPKLARVFSSNWDGERAAAQHSAGARVRALGVATAFVKAIETVGTKDAAFKHAWHDVAYILPCAVAALAHPNQRVREAAVELLVAVCRYFFFLKSFFFKVFNFFFFFLKVFEL